MPTLSCSSGPRCPSVALALLLLLLPVAVQAATIEEKLVTHTLRPDGSVLERTRLSVSMESPADLERWATLPIYLDQNRRLLEVEAYTQTAAGDRLKVRRRDRDRLDYSGEGVLHASDSFELLSFRGLAVGNQLVADYSVEVEPYFPTGQIPLVAEDTIRSLRIEVRSGQAAQPFRHHLAAESWDAPEQPRLHLGEGLLRLEASEIPAWSPAFASPAARPVLHYGWSRPGNWSEVARWYNELLTDLPRAGPQVVAAAHAATAETAEGQDSVGEDPARLDPALHRLRALLDIASTEVKYTAVEVGIGGYRPSAPSTVLARRWGDCKDKSLLLIDLLSAAGISAIPVLVRADELRRVDARFPDPYQFNHMIVALARDQFGAPFTSAPSADIALDADDESQPVPAAEDSPWLFLDPTQSPARIGWLSPALSGQGALLIRPDGGQLIALPVDTDSDQLQLVAEMQLDAQGNAEGSLLLRYRGWRAAALTASLAAEAEPRDLLRRVLNGQLPRAQIHTASWHMQNTPLGIGPPQIDLRAEIRLTGVGQISAERRALVVPGLTTTPDPREIQDRHEAMVLEPRTVEAHWRFALPEGWCPAANAELRTNNPLGEALQQVATAEDGRLTVQRRLRIQRRQVEVKELHQLEDLAVAERRAQRRRIRLLCE